MKPCIFTIKPYKLAFAALLVACLPLSSVAHESHDKPIYGGIVGEAGSLQLELVLRPSGLVLHVSNHRQPVDLKGASAKMVLLSGKEKTDISLAVSGGKFEAKPITGTFPTQKGVKAVATITLPGKAPATVRFELP